MKIEPLKYFHLKALADADAWGAKAICDDLKYYDALVLYPAFVGIVDEGVVAAMGMVEQNPGNFRCWAVTHPVLTPRYLVVVCKAMRRFMREHKARRIETVVMVGNSCAERWVRLLGFVRGDIPMRGFNEQGDAWLYELVR